MRPLGLWLKGLVGTPDVSPMYRELTRGGVHWQVWPDAEWAVRAVADQPALRQIKASSRRKVFWLEGGPLPLLIKVYELWGVQETMKALLRQSAGHREWALFQEAYRRHLPVPRPLAFGEAWSQGLPRRAFLVCEGLDGVALSQYYGATPGPQEKRALLDEVARTLRQAHDAGLLQPDLHAGNLLFCPGKGVFLVDLQRGRLREPLSLRQRVRNLAILASSFGTLLSRSDRLRFWQAYVAGCPRWQAATRQLWAEIHANEVRHRRREWRGKDHRCLRDSRTFLAFHGGGYWGFCQRRYATSRLLKLLEAPNRVFDDPRCHLVKDSRTTKAGRCSSLPDGPELFIKRYNYQGFLYAMKDLVRSSRARRAWVTANGLQARGISTAPPIAYLERRRWRVLHESYLITEAIEGEGLLEFTRRGAESQAFFREKRRLVSEIATLLRRLHESGVSHRDLKGQNILLQEESPGRFRPLLVDLDGVRLGRVGWRRRVRDLARLARAFRENGAVTRTDRVRFLRAYLGPRGRPAQRTLWDRIAALEARARR